jgi:hypothetical protein
VSVMPSRKRVAIAGLVLAAPLLAGTATAAQAAPPARVDASVAIESPGSIDAGEIQMVRFTARSDKPATNYRMTINIPDGLYFWEPEDYHSPWKTESSSARTITLRYHGAATTAPPRYGQALGAGPGAGRWLAVQAKLAVAETDVNPGNNVATNKVFVAAGNTATLAGRVWNDTNRNGRQDRGEHGLANVKVDLWVGPDKRGQLAFTTRTGTDGSYRILGVPAWSPLGDQYVIETTAPGSAWTYTKADVGNGTGDSDVVSARPNHPSGSPVRDPLRATSPYLKVANGKTTLVDAGLYRR